MAVGMTPRLGLWTPLPHTTPPDPAMDAAIADAASPGGPGFDRALALARDAAIAAERLGFAVTLIAERWLGPDHAAWIMATALACATQSIELMVAVHPGILPPQAVAKLGATLDRVSGGRFSMNLVNGWWAEEMEMFGPICPPAWLPASEARYHRMDEFVQVVRKLWTEDAPRFDGTFYRLPGRTLPLRPVQPCPPIYAASRADAGKDIVARHADCWFAECGTDFRQADANLRAIAADIADMRARAARHGRTLRFGLSASVLIAGSHAEAVARAEALEEYGTRDRVALSAVKALGAGLLGTPHQVAARIEAYAEAGIDTLMLRFDPVLEGLELFGRTVMPLLSPPPSPGPAPAASATAR